MDSLFTCKAVEEDTVLMYNRSAVFLTKEHGILWEGTDL